MEKKVLGISSSQLENQPWEHNSFEARGFLCLKIKILCIISLCIFSTTVNILSGQKY